MNVLRGVGVFLYTLLIYLGIPLLGWGVGDLPGFFAAWAHLGYTAVVVAFAFVIGIQASFSMEGIQDGPGMKDRTVQRQNLVGMLLVGVCAAALFFAPLSARVKFGVLPGDELLAWIGVILTALGYGLVFWSGAALGRFYSAQVTLQSGHQLITSGPYHLVRHPRYLGILLVISGASLTFHAWIGLVCLFVALVLVLSRISDEETLMSQTFGDTWRRYARRTRRLIPFIY